MTRWLTALLPLAILLALSVFACLLGYGLFLLFPGVPLNQFISKATLVFLLLSLVPAMRWLTLSRQDLGFANPGLFFPCILKGFGLGIITLLPVIVLLYGLGVNVIDETHVWTLGKLFDKLGVALLLALLISMLEEPLFRGVLLLGLSKKLSRAAAVALSAGYYAALHFITNKSKIPDAELDLTAAFKLLAGAYANLANPEITSAFLSLLMVGIFLGLLRLRARTGLAWCVGCHAAWVWQIKATKELFNTDPQSPYLFLVSSYDGVIGLLVAAWLFLGLLGYWVFLKMPSANRSDYS